MGVCTSSAEKNEDLPQQDQQKNIAAQRRRLSVAPQHVDNKLLGGEDEKREAETINLDSLTEIEKRALQKNNCAAESRKGLVPYNKTKVNQDRLMVKFAVGNDESVSLFGVLDGHGEFGHFVAEFVKQKLPINIAAQDSLKSQPAKSITAAVKTTCDQLATTNINVAFSGTTAVFGLHIEDRLIIANIGDSRCVLCRLLEKGSNRWEAIALTVDQKPENPKEKARIIKSGGRVEPLPGPPGEDCGPPRVWLAEVDVPGLAMSRSIGDEVSQTVGVISTPEITEHEISTNDVFVIWASDGVWEFLSNEEACAIVWNSRDNLKTACVNLITEAQRRWKQEEDVVDDITCVILGLNNCP